MWRNNWTFHAGGRVDLDESTYKDVSQLLDAHLQKDGRPTAPPWPASASGPLLYGFPPYCWYCV
jgi:hypothetical protein